MKKILILVLVILIIFPVLAVGENNITITKIEGQVEKMEKESIFFNLVSYNKWNKLTNEDKVEAGDIIRTGKGGNLEFFFDNGTFLKIGEETQFEVGEGKITELGKAYSLHLAAGRIWAKVQGAWKELTKFEVITPSAVAGVKGTLFSVSFDGEKTTASVQEGQIEIHNILKTEQRLIREGEMGLVIGNNIHWKKIEGEEIGAWSNPQISEWLEDVVKSDNKVETPAKEIQEWAEKKAEEARGKSKEDKVEEDKDIDEDENEEEEDEDEEDNDESGEDNVDQHAGDNSNKGGNPFN